MKKVVNLAFRSGLTAVEQAAKEGNTEGVFFFFLRRLAHPRASITLARENGYETLARKIEEFLREKKCQRDNLRRGIEKLDCERVATALGYGLDVNEVLSPSAGFAALHLALFSCDFFFRWRKQN